MFRNMPERIRLTIFHFVHDMGFRAMFDNGLPGRPVEEQNKIAAHMQKLSMELGPYVLYADFSVTSFVLNTSGSTADAGGKNERRR